MFCTTNKLKRKQNNNVLIHFEMFEKKKNSIPCMYVWWSNNSPLNAK